MFGLGLISSRTLIHDSSPPTLVLQLVQNVNKVNVYIKTGFQLPVGLVPGTLWKISNVMKLVSKKENIYLGMFKSSFIQIFNFVKLFNC